jgi:cytochrome c oxidase subunit II
VSPFRTPPIAVSLLLVASNVSLLARPQDASVKAIEVTASRFEFQPERIEVEEGDHVRLTLHSADTKHGLAIPELGVKTTIPKGGAPVTVEFVASKAGTFGFKCSEYCGSGHKKMTGTLVVVARAQ